MIIYKVQNKLNGKMYIGKTIQDFEKYKHIHIRSAKNGYDLKKGCHPRIFYNAIRKYGEENFEWEILYTCDDKKKLNEKEIFFIDKYESFIKGYNMTQGGDGGDGGFYCRTNEIRDKISLSLMGKKRSQESKEKQSKSISGEKHPLYGIGHSDKTKEKIRLSKTGDKNHNYKKYKIIDPIGNEYIITGGFQKFCLKHHLWRNGLRSV